MKTTGSYSTVVALSKLTGYVIGTRSAGAGGCCKHVAAFLYNILDYVHVLTYLKSGTDRKHLLAMGRFSFQRSTLYTTRMGSARQKQQYSEWKSTRSIGHALNHCDLYWRNRFIDFAQSLSLTKRCQCFTRSLNWQLLQCMVDEVYPSSENSGHRTGV